MTTFEAWSLVISAFTAIGTIGAVAIALWATLHRRKRFVVKNIDVRSMMEHPQKGADSEPAFKEGFVYFMIENRQEFQLEVMSITLMLSRMPKKGRYGPTATGVGESLRGSFIPALSQYEVRLGVLGKQISFPEREVGDITCEIKTSAGDTVVPFPAKWRDLLFRNLEFVENEQG